MKKTIFFSLTFILTLRLANAQNDPYMLIHTVSKDSTHTVEFEEFFNYDSNGKQTESIEYSYLGGTTSGNKSNWSYDNITGYVTEKIYYNFDNITSTWEPNYKTEFTQYDSNGNILEEISSFYDNVISNQWEYSLKTVYTYNNNLLDNKEDFYYDDTDPNNPWKEQSKTVYTYSSGLLTLETFQMWNPSQNQYEDYTKNHYTYDSNNLLIEKRYENFDANNSVWVNSTKTIYTYDNSSKLISEESYGWNMQNNIWEGNNKSVYTYDNLDNLSSGEFYEYDTSNNQWYSAPKYIGSATHDNSVDYNNLGLPEEYNQGIQLALFNHKLDSFNFTKLDPNTGSYNFFESHEYFYTPLSVLGVNTGELADVNIYPNPVSTTLNIEGSKNLTDYKIFLYDMQGKQVLYRTGQNQINVQTLKPGNYIYRIVAKEGIKNGVMIKN